MQRQAALSAGRDTVRQQFLEDVAGVVHRRVARVGQGDGLVEEPLPAELLPLHMPAVQEALGCLIPQQLHPGMDKAAQKEKIVGETARGGVYLQWVVGVLMYMKKILWRRGVWSGPSWNSS